MKGDREKNPDAASAAPPAAHRSRPAPVTPGRPSLRARLRQAWKAARIWLVNPAPQPDEFGKPAVRHHRPIPIELGFFLHADGKVYWRQRDRSGDRLVVEGTVIAMVHTEYRGMIARARRAARWRRLIEMLKSAPDRSAKQRILRNSGLDTAKRKAVP